MASPKVKHTWWPGFLCALIFFLTGCSILPYPGLQNDEVLFAPSYFGVPGSSILQVEVFHHQVPLMLLSYLGALKTWIYAIPLAIFSPSSWTVRLPVLFLGSVTVWLFFILLDSIHGRRAAWIGGLLLASDTMFLLTTCFDWGPVAFQHLLLLGGLVLIARFSSAGARTALFSAFFCFGLAFWDKALFVWIMAGITFGTLVIFTEQVKRCFTTRNVTVALGGLCLGALPLITFNAETRLSTLKSNSSFRFDEFPKKFRALRGTWNGSIMFGFIVSQPAEPGQPSEPANALERASFTLHSIAGDHTSNGLEWAIVTAPLLSAFLWRRPGTLRIVLFCSIALAVAWVQMAIAKDAGGSAHHVVLLWPIPHLFLAVALAEASQLVPRRVGIGLLSVALVYLVGENLLLTNQYLYQFARYGAPRNWTNAIYGLSDELASTRPSQIVLADWGMQAPLVLLQHGTLPLTLADDSFLSPAQSEPARRWDLGRLEQGLWVGHTLAYRQFVQLNDNVLKTAASAGFRKELIKVISDSHGRAAFEIFRFVRSVAPPEAAPQG